MGDAHRHRSCFNPFGVPTGGGAGTDEITDLQVEEVLAPGTAALSLPWASPLDLEDQAGQHDAVVMGVGLETALCGPTAAPPPCLRTGRS